MLQKPQPAPVETPESDDKPAQPADKTPVMDVRPPAAPVHAETPAPVKPTETPAPNEAEPEKTTADEPVEEKAKPAKAVKPPKPSREPGVTLAIVATIIIVLGLAALATYAYLRVNNVAPF